jgi:hypothetical protein
MRRSSPRWAIANNALALLVFVLGCGSEDPSELTGDDYFPLTVGSRWEYDDNHDGLTERLFKSMTECAPDTTFEDCASEEPITVQAVVFSSTGSDNPEESGNSFLILRDDGVYRIRQDQQDADEPEPEVIRTYSPGFLRFPRGTLTVGAQWDSEHTRCEEDLNDDPPTSSREEKLYHWLIEDIETITVPAGTFEDAIKLRRVTEGSGETKLYWYVANVGKVLEQLVDGETVLREEELISYEIGTEACAL